MNKLSVVVATKNEQECIASCLESIKWADEIIIVDDMSTDRTAQICREYTKKIFFNDSRGSFHENKNLAIDKATGDWILALDADEIVGPELAKEIKEVMVSPEKIGYYIPRKNYFLDRWIRGCGWWPCLIIRLFKKGATRWPLDTHSWPEIEGKEKVGCLRNPLIHYSYRDLNQYFNKFNFYTSRLARDKYEEGIRVNRENFLVHFLIKPLFWFFRKYILWTGFRDGFRGFFISFSSALVIFVTYAKLWERQNVNPVRSIRDSARGSKISNGVNPVRSSHQGCGGRLRRLTPNGASNKAKRFSL